MAEPADQDPTESLDPATAAFAEFLARVEDGESVSFAAYAAEHPHLAAKMAALHERWQALGGAFDDVQDAAGKQPESGSSGIQLEADDASRTQLLRDLNREDPQRPRYAIAGEFARGGMAAILRARDKCLRRTLAMKVLLDDPLNAARGGPRYPDQRTLARFLEEAQITGQLDHPGIPSVHELGIDSQGRVFFTMPLIKGQNLSEIYALVRAGSEGWALPRAVACLQRVCETVAYAHSRGVVHRDLKPSNVMVGRFGETYVMDWGLALVHGRGKELRDQKPDAAWSSIRTVRGELDGEGVDAPLITLDGHVVGTPAYMAPEQARGEAGAVGPRSDVHSIGAMLYELLAGHVPYVPSGARLSARTVLARVLEGPPAPLQPSKDRPDELLAICAKAMARAPENRYASASELGNDLRAWLEGRVVQAHATGTWAELRKWVGRNRALSAAIVLLVAALAVGLGVTVVLGGRARSAAAALAAELRANNIERGRLFAASGDLDRAERLLWAEHLRDPQSLASRVALWDLHSRYPCRATANFAEELRRGALVADGASLAVGDSAGNVHFLDAATLARRGKVVPAQPSSLTAMATDQRNLVFTAHADGALYVIDVPTQQLVRTLHTGSVIGDMVYCAATRGLAVGCNDGSVLLYDTTNWDMRRVVEPTRSAVRRITCRDDGNRFATLSNDHLARIHDRDGKVLATSKRATDPLACLCFTPDGDLLFGGQERLMQVMDAGSGATTTVLQKPDTVSFVAMGAAGDRVIACGWRSLEVLSLPDYHRVGRIDLPSAPPNGSVVLDANCRVAITVHTHEVRSWDLQDAGHWSLGPHDGRSACLLAPDGRTVFTGDSAGSLRSYDLAAPTTPKLLGKLGNRIRSLAIDPRGQVLLCGSTGALEVRDLTTGQVRQTFRDHDDVSQQSVCFAPDGQHFAHAVRRNGQCYIAVLELASFAEQLVPVATSQIIGIGFSPAGDRIACTSRGRGVFLFDRSGSQLQEFKTLEQCWSLTFRPDGSRLATGTWGRTIDIFDTATGALHQRLEGHAGTVWNVGWLQHDERVLYSAGADGQFQLWDVDGGSRLLTREPFGSGLDVVSVSTSADGRRFSFAGASPTVAVWDVDYFERLVAGNVAAQTERLTESAQPR